MARPKTEAASYKMVTFRVPPDLLAQVNQLREESGAPLNTELIKLVRQGLKAKTCRGGPHAAQR